MFSLSLSLKFQSLGDLQVKLIRWHLMGFCCLHFFCSPAYPKLPMGLSSFLLSRIVSLLLLHTQKTRVNSTDIFLENLPSFQSHILFLQLGFYIFSLQVMNFTVSKLGKVNKIRQEYDFRTFSIFCTPSLSSPLRFIQSKENQNTK